MVLCSWGGRQALGPHCCLSFDCAFLLFFILLRFCLAAY